MEDGRDRERVAVEVALRRRAGASNEVRERLDAANATHSDFRGKCAVCGLELHGSLEDLRKGCPNGCDTRSAA